ncbi:MAG: hypothetical protein JWO51_1728 [Rhodospirillales bacterium]|nr:hypothetical protein [Rhodospirillales bacterium]
MRLGRSSFIRRLPATALLAGLLASCAHAPSAPRPVTQSFGDFAAPAGYAHYLACPEDYCLTRPDGVTPSFKVPADKMRFIAKRAIDALPKTQLISTSNEGLRLVYQTHSGGLFDHTETVTIEVVDADEGVSGLVIYGQSDLPGGDAADLKTQMEAWYAAIYRAANP